VKNLEALIAMLPIINLQAHLGDVLGDASLRYQLAEDIPALYAQFVCHFITWTLGFLLTNFIKKGLYFELLVIP